MSKIFVTGGSGFIGTNLVQLLVEKQHAVVNYDIRAPRNKENKPYWFQGNILDFSTLSGSVKEFSPDFIVHLAARTDLDGHDISGYTENTTGVLNLLNTLAGIPSPQQIIFASSRLVCKIGYQPESEGDFCPTTAYGKSKAIGETLVRENSGKIPCPWSIVRPTSIWGPWFDTPYKEFFMSILNGHYIHPKQKQILKSFGYVGNFVYQIEKMLFSVDPNLFHTKTFYLADYPPLDVKSWADLIASKSGRPPTREMSIGILKLIALLGDVSKCLGWRKPPLTSFRLNNLLTDMVYDTTLVESFCGHLPYNLRAGVVETLDWIESEK